ncbi:MAG: hypothetical protein M3Y07_06310 [Acidobacteriota bacterium]|nr:hypothetical protein [Acidobacteriota bacterium]
MTAIDIGPRVAAIERAILTGAMRGSVEKMRLNLEKEVVASIREGSLDVVSVMIASLPERDRRSLLAELSLE